MKLNRKKATITLLIFFIGTFNLLNKRVESETSLTIGAIPDQNPEKLNRLYSLLSSELSKELKVPVKYIPVTNYTAAVTGFRTGSLDLVWFGGLTGVQARLQRPGSKVLAQRNIDRKFHSVFIANTNSQISPIKNIRELKVFKGKRFTFGSESSTSGRLMPQYYLQKAGIKLNDFKGGRPGFSGSHDATIALVQSGSYEAGVLNEQVWKSTIQKSKVELSKVKVIWRTPAYADYHWLVQPNLDNKFGLGFTNKIKKALIGLNKKSNDQAKILNLFGAEKFIPSNSKNYDKIEKVGRQLGKIR